MDNNLKASILKNRCVNEYKKFKKGAECHV